MLFKAIKYRLAFTLAEILITLSIIGVIASMTIPSLVQDVQDAQLKTAWKKAYAELDQITRMTVREQGGAFVGFITSNDDTLMNLYAPYLNYTKKCNKSSTIGNCWHTNDKWKHLNNKPIDDSYATLTIYNGSGLISNSGMLFKFVTYNSCNAVNCGDILVDVNGFKGPNIVGKDIFRVYITRKFLRPFGYQGDSQQNTCTPDNSGFGCSTEFLYK